MPTVSTMVSIDTEDGLHARPASKVVALANEFDSTVELSAGDDDGTATDATSVIGVTSLNLQEGDRLQITADGPDAEEAIEELRTLIVEQGHSPGEVSGSA